jgi:hypothetical protein
LWLDVLNAGDVQAVDVKAAAWPWLVAWSRNVLNATARAA